VRQSAKQFKLCPHLFIAAYALIYPNAAEGQFEAQFLAPPNPDRNWAGQIPYGIDGILKLDHPTGAPKKSFNRKTSVVQLVL